MSRQMFQNIQSLSGIEGVGFGEFDMSICSNNDSVANDKYTIKINAPQGQLAVTSPFAEKVSEGDSRKIATKNSYSTETTGYDINRELFSDDDIREAFNVIDINSEGYLTSDKLSFFLKCMDQPHSTEQVQEMIRMVSNDGKRVMIEDFKKVGRGKLPPFAAIKHPEVESSLKEEVLENVRSSLLTEIEPEDFFQIKEDLKFSHQKYEDEKTRQDNCRQSVEETLGEENGGMRLRTVKQLAVKREHYNEVVMLNVDKAIESLKLLKAQRVQLGVLAETLSISEGEARLLFQKSRVSVREVLFDIILFSRESRLRKIQLLLTCGGRGETLFFQQWVTLLCFLMGVDRREFISRRLSDILLFRKKQLRAGFNRYFILQLMVQQENQFFW